MSRSLRRARDASGAAPTLAFLAALLVGLCAADLRAQGFLCLEGGGDVAEGNWESSTFEWAVERAGGGPLGPTVVVLSTQQAAPQLTASLLAAGAQSAINLVVPPALADDLAVFNQVSLADLVWIADEPVEDLRAAWLGSFTALALQVAYDEGGVLGGSGGGARLLGGVLLDTTAGELDARDALADAFAPELAFADPVLDVLPDALVDDRFTLHGRIGRLGVMLARAEADLGVAPLGIGLDRRTALCIEPDRTAMVRGEGSVTLLHALPETRAQLDPGAPPTVTDLRYLQLVEGYRVDLDTRAVLERPAHAVLQGPPLSDPIFATLNVGGENPDSAKLGDVRVLYPLGTDSLFLGAMQITDGQNMLLRTVVSPSTWQIPVAREVTVGGLQYALSQSPHFLGMLLDQGVRVRTSEADLLLVLPVPGQTERSAVLLDSFGVVSTAVSTHVAVPGTSVGPRQSAAIDDARLHVLRPGDGYDARQHAALLPDDAFIDLGEALGGSLGEPVLDGDGVVIEFNTLHAQLDNAAPGSVAFLLLGGAALNQPFKLGTLVPVPQNISPPVPTGLDGSISLSFLWPAGLPRGLAVYAQFWIADSSAGVGWAASNGLLIQAP